MKAEKSFLNRRTSQFLAIYETGNIRDAAVTIGLTQPAVSMGLQQLEDELGTPLFNRSVKGVVPTSAGKIYYRYACNLRQSAIYAAQEIEEQVRGHSGTLRIGAGLAWASTFIPPVLVHIKKKFPNLTIDLVAGVADQLAEKFETGKLDLLLAAGPIEPLASPEFLSYFLTNIPMVAMADPSHSLASHKTVSLKQLQAAEWAGFYEDDTFVYHATQFFALHGLNPPTISMRTNAIAALTEFVKSTETITLVSSPIVPRSLEAGLVILPLTEPLWEIPVKIHLRHVAAQLGPIKMFIDKIHEVI
ncbi:LysR family transcriptional regulator [Pseudovibrio sp. Tun.PSC04-5.I4]|uniref:LysR family transcriptional regulator n=1 Tax=Pseudovibrio sp. Tun.PSC04-5.I4 TaxID=1798213 RepID=UPI00088C0723|nr:LysR family transcriptional regulator [Pseudovibrio sp. Tun.PSC04-5.I4]SDQ74732.1 DNA-binding transcriptional regulator, LysR family [Pseudovibrio sp. Tun.PSC04-5.I4]